MRIFLLVFTFLLISNNSFGANCYDDIEETNSYLQKSDYRADGKTLLWFSFKNKNRKKDIIVYRIGLFSKDNEVMRESSYELEVPAKKKREFGLNVSPEKFNINLSNSGKGYWFCKYAVQEDNKKKNSKQLEPRSLLEKLLGKN